MKHKWLVLIFLLALFLRLYKLDKIPNGFFFDEATISYQAYSIIKTGQDTWGIFLPAFSFRDYGEYILPLGVYGHIPSIAVSGLNVFPARFSDALVGTLLIPGVYILGGPVAALLLSFQPLALGWSRFVFEGNFGTLFFLYGLVTFVYYLRKRKLLWLSIALFGLSMESYHIFLVTTPVFVLLLYFLFRQKVRMDKKVIFVTGIFLIWSAVSTYQGAGRARFNQAATLITSEKLDILNHQIGYCQKSLPTLICRLFLNKPLLAMSSYVENYAGHFSPVFLGFDGTFLRRNVLPRSGLLPLAEVATFFLGIYFLIRRKGEKRKILFAWLLVYPLANSFSGVGEISRIAFAAPLFSLISAIAISRVRWFFPLVVLSAMAFLINYFAVFPTTNAYYANFGYDQIYRFVRQNQDKFNRVYITRGYAGSVPYISALFFLPVNPQTFLQRVDRYQDEREYYLTTRIGNIYYYDDITKLSLKKDDFLVATPEELVGKTYTLTFTIIDPTNRTLLIGVRVKDIVDEKI